MWLTDDKATGTAVLKAWALTCRTRGLISLATLPWARVTAFCLVRKAATKQKQTQCPAQLLKAFFRWLSSGGKTALALDTVPVTLALEDNTSLWKCPLLVLPGTPGFQHNPGLSKFVSPLDPKGYIITEKNITIEKAFILNLLCLRCIALRVFKLLGP